MWDKDRKGAQLIGATEIDLENRIFSQVPLTLTLTLTPTLTLTLTLTLTGSSRRSALG